MGSVNRAQDSINAKAGGYADQSHGDTCTGFAGKSGAVVPVASGVTVAEDA